MLNLCFVDVSSSCHYKCLSESNANHSKLCNKVFFLFFYPFFLWVYLVCFTCSLYFIFMVTHIHLRWFATCPTWFRPSPKPQRGTWRLTRECMHFDQSCHKSMWASDNIFQACEAGRHIFSSPCRWETLKRISQRIHGERGLNPRPSNPQSKSNKWSNIVFD